MRITLPPLTCHGAMLLGGGVFRRGTLSLEGGRIGSRGDAVVDLEGYAILPGGVDLGGVSGDMSMADLAAAAAPAGTTSLWVDVEWPSETGAVAPARERLDAIEAARPSLPVALYPRIVVSTHGVATAPALMETVQRVTRPLVVFRHPVKRERPVLEAEFGGAGSVARHLCRLATFFDAAGLRYGTDSDPDAEHRERFSMIGARMAMRPAARGAAVSARAMEEPVVLSADDMLDAGQIGRGLATMLLAEGLCDAIGSFGPPERMQRAVHRIAEAGRVPFGHAWSLISSAPAGIARLTDRGGLVEGTRADLVIVEQDTLDVAATVTAGVLVHATPDALARFRPALKGAGLAAE